MTEVHEKSGRSERGRWRRRLAMLAAATMIAGIGVMLASVSSASANPGDKWFVCKFTTTPGGDEVLQSGQNPISVSENAIPVSPVTVGAQFSDAQGLSIVLVQDTGQAEPSPEDCLALIETPPPTPSTPSTPTTPVTPATPANPTTSAPIPVAVAAGQHATVSGTTVLLGTLLMVLGVGGVLTAWRPWKRGSH